MSSRQWAGCPQCVGEAADDVARFGVADLNAALAASQCRQVLRLDRSTVRENELQHVAAVGYQPEPPFLGQGDDAFHRLMPVATP
jgi:hypothetical protein